MLVKRMGIAYSSLRQVINLHIIHLNIPGEELTVFIGRVNHITLGIQVHWHMLWVLMLRSLTHLS